MQSRSHVYDVMVGFCFFARDLRLRTELFRKMSVLSVEIIIQEIHTTRSKREGGLQV